MGANAWRTDGHSVIHPLLAEGNRLLAFGTIQRVGTMLAIHGDVHNRGPRFFHGRPKLLQVFRIRRREMARPGLALVYLEFLDDMGGEIFQVHGLRSFAVLSGDELPERIRSDGDSFPRLRR